MYSHGRTTVVVVGCLANDWQQLQVTSCIYLTEVTGRGTMYIIREDGPPQYLHNVITVYIVHNVLTPHIYLYNTCVRPSYSVYNTIRIPRWIWNKNAQKFRGRIYILYAYTDKFYICIYVYTVRYADIRSWRKTGRVVCI